MNSKSTRSKVLSILLTAVIALAAIAGYDITILQPRAANQPAVAWPGPTRGTTNLSDFSADTLTVSGAASTGALSVTGAASSSTTQTVGTFFVLTPATSITVTNGSTITPTTSYQGITAAGAVGTSSIAIKPAGTLLRLINTSAQTITITDTGTLLLNADIALGQYDVLLLQSDGTNWVQTAPVSNN